MKKLNALKKWLGCSDHLIWKTVDKTYRGIFTTKDIKQDELIMDIPEDKLIKEENLENELITAEEIEQQHYKINSIFGFYLMQHLFKKEESSWKPYLDTLPETVDHPLFYTNDEWETIQGSPILNKDFKGGVHKYGEMFFCDCEALYYWKGKEFYPDYDDYLKCYTLARLFAGSRNFSYKKNGRTIRALVPYVDLLNHSNDHNTRWFFNENTKTFQVVATRDIPKGSEVLDSYGKVTNHKMLLHYGFTLPSNTTYPLFIKKMTCEISLPATAEKANKLVSVVQSQFGITDNNEAKEATKALLNESFEAYPTKLSPKANNPNCLQLVKEEKLIIQEYLKQL